jgi:lysophospholipase L1-like esterase
VPIRLASRSLLVESLLGAVTAPKAEGYAPAWEWAGGDRKGDVPDAAVAAYERNLRSIAAVAASRAARTLVVAQTARVRTGSERSDREYLESWAPGLTAEGFRRALERYNGVAARLGKEGLLLFHDPFAGGDFADADFVDPMHFGDAGATKLAARLAAVIGRLLPGSDPPVGPATAPGSAPGPS